ncbi:hypothetical protein PIB30_021421 [Stylosanthes scabra]|uniref:Uncharacterized protein n=1 Tax=Stylosanthes scabra TaxID=79078 RepID=A0ABU6UAM9_9FABA|nr:hypothetical protein [Stylosanthes scabra]
MSWFSVFRGSVPLWPAKGAGNVVSGKAEDGAVARVTNGGLLTRRLRRFVLLTPPPILSVILPWNHGDDGKEWSSAGVPWYGGRGNIEGAMLSEAPGGRVGGHSSPWKGGGWLDAADVLECSSPMVAREREEMALKSLFLLKSENDWRLDGVGEQLLPFPGIVYVWMTDHQERESQIANGNRREHDFHEDGGWSHAAHNIPRHTPPSPSRFNSPTLSI